MIRDWFLPFLYLLYLDVLRSLWSDTRPQ